MAQQEANYHADHLFREAYGEILASLAARFGFGLLDSIEDALQDTFIKAMQVWGYQGLPDNPRAWLYTAARNRLLDLLRKEKKQVDFPLESQAATELLSGASDSQAMNVDSQVVNLDSQEVQDAQLRMIFACCHPALSREYQLLLSLKLVAGFNNREVGRVLLKKEEAIAKAYTRAKKALGQQLDVLEPIRNLALRNRSVVVYQVIYLMFTEGYRPQSGDSGLRKDLCFEALRLAILLDTNSTFKTHDLSALIALMAFHAARFDARFDADGKLVDLEHQDRSKYNGELIAYGKANWEVCQQDQPFSSRYHLEAGIAYLHARAKDYASTDWASILLLYDAHLARQFSPIVALNRLVALAESGNITSAQKALEELAKAHPMVAEKALFHALRARIFHNQGAFEKAEEAFARAADLSQNNLEKVHFEAQGRKSVAAKNQVRDQPSR
ncbi:RNA polymerase sigma-70 factor, ECF subfamily [Robiginitalea myxolifaciens]|uniref:RNA polymerase sigma-70 factor, ECF subfamily n=1 Tax=Robiginitalea myxolifaciens TaxID=400055 RepID=A0A1I6FZP5_9FLAO|nr:sigma-70 family RNA polymerase sigma factor [Robiginitalea myxolifaciens]SFR35433.1 RNA polymerase sigma-70 factor, ECF subfamily [Robiginitalea myxolifaciens]